MSIWDGRSKDKSGRDVWRPYGAIMKGYILPPGFDTQPLRRIGLFRTIGVGIVGVLPALGLEVVKDYSGLRFEELLIHPVTLFLFASIWIVGLIFDRFVIEPHVTDLEATPAHWAAMPLHALFYCFLLGTILIYAGLVAVGFTVLGTFVGISFGKHLS
jgi:hypothetical protein